MIQSVMLMDAALFSSAALLRTIRIGTSSPVAVKVAPTRKTRRDGDEKSIMLRILSPANYCTAASAAARLRGSRSTRSVTGRIHDVTAAGAPLRESRQQPRAQAQNLGQHFGKEALAAESHRLATIYDRAAKRRVAAATSFRPVAEAGGLRWFGLQGNALYRQMAQFV
jgi:hypothetical protein